ncbi:MAG TPA: DUF1127 domain-containing protein [Myxococcaceae bacterium]|nr:DUF1127 domain-containing protein [Myxococcaceae bacterium]
MAQTLKKPVPGLTAAHLAAFTSVSEAPQLHLPGFDRREPEYRAAVYYPQWWRSPAIVMRGWRPRPIERPQSLGERIAATAVAAFDRVRKWRDRAQSRQALLHLDDRMLRDLGIDRATAQYLGSRPFWRADD